MGNHIYDPVMLMVPRKIRRGWEKHHRTDIDTHGREVESTGKNLWKRIQNSRTKYIVDNHWPWERYLGCREYFPDAFILGTTRLNEQSQLIRLIEDPRGKKKIGKNVFLFSFRGQMGTIHRLDEQLLSTFNRNKLAAIGDPNSPESLVALPANAKVEDEISALISEVRGELIHVLQRGKAIARRRDSRHLDGLLYSKIQNQRTSCYANCFASIEVARQAYALLLINCQRARKNFIEKGSANGFYDAAMIGNALFFGAEVLSSDEGVREMARFCHVKSHRDLPSLRRETQDRNILCGL